MTLLPRTDRERYKRFCWRLHVEDVPFAGSLLRAPKIPVWDGMTKKIVSGTFKQISKEKERKVVLKPISGIHHRPYPNETKML